MVLSRDSRWLITASEDKTARRWDLKNPSADPSVYRGHDDAIRALAVDPDGRWLVTASDDGGARFWELAADYNSPEPIVFRAHAGNVLGMSLDTGRGRIFTASRDSTARAWDWLALTKPWPEREGVSCTAEFARHRVGVTALATDPAGRWLVTGASDGSLLRWELDDPSAEPERFAAPHRGPVTAITISPKGKWLVTAGRDRQLLRRDLEDTLADPTSFTGHSGAVASLAIRPSGDWLVAGSWDAELLAWDLSAPSNFPQEFTRQAGGGDVIGALDFSPDGSWLASGDNMDMTAQLWDFGSKSPIGRTLKCEAPVTSIRFTTDQDGMVTGLAAATDDFNVQLWTLNGEQMSAGAVLKGHTDHITAIQVSRDGRWLVSASHDGTVRLWRLRMDDLLDQARRAVGRSFTKDGVGKRIPREAIRQRPLE